MAFFRPLFVPYSPILARRAKANRMRNGRGVMGRVVYVHDNDVSKGRSHVGEISAKLGRGIYGHGSYVLRA